MKSFDLLVQTILNSLRPTKKNIIIAIALAAISPLFFYIIAMYLYANNYNSIYFKYITIVTLGVLQFLTAGNLLAKHIKALIDNDFLNMVMMLTFQPVWYYLLTAPTLYLMERRKLKKLGAYK